MPACAPLLDSRGEFYRKRLEDLLGAEKAGSVVYPTQEVKDGAEIDLGDRILRFTAHGPAHTPSDLSMLDTGSGLLFPADLLFVNRIPSLDGSLVGWLKEIERLKGRWARRRRCRATAPWWWSSHPPWPTSRVTSPPCATRPARR